jgi:16S rRNA (cytosine967-C5)-methyltransferase
MQRAPFRGEELRAVPQLVCGESEIRTLPAHWTELGGLDGFFVARLRRTH